jgi:predicted ATP-grasp superfamily ATP-dependent carboligase
MLRTTIILRIYVLLLASLACVLAQEDFYKVLGGKHVSWSLILGDAVLTLSINHHKSPAKQAKQK